MKIKLTNKVYDTLKWLVITLLPALTTFLAVVLPACDCPEDFVRRVGVILPALTTFLGAIIGISNTTYKKSLTEAEHGEGTSGEEN